MADLKHATFKGMTAHDGIILTRSAREPRGFATILRTGEIPMA